MKRISNGRGMIKGSDYIWRFDQGRRKGERKGFFPSSQVKGVPSTMETHWMGMGPPLMSPSNGKVESYESYCLTPSISHTLSLCLTSHRVYGIESETVTPIWLSSSSSLSSSPPSIVYLQALYERVWRSESNEREGETERAHMGNKKESL